jgi:tripartite-type tricarboxylate transporter receptor subunit TctC
MPISSTFVVLPVMQPKLPLDLARDIVPIGLVGEQPMAIAVHRSLGVNSLAELVTMARQRPGKVLFGAGRGSIPHMTGEMLQQRLGIEIAFIPYPSQARAMQDAIAGTLSVAVESMSGFAAPMQAGTLKVLAVASAQRLPDFPELPTVGEAVPDLRGFEARGWFALMAPSSTPEAIVRKVSEDLHAVLAQDEVKQKFRSFGTYPRPISSAQTAEFIRGEQELWKPVAKRVADALR